MPGARCAVAATVAAQNARRGASRPASAPAGSFVNPPAGGVARRGITPPPAVSVLQKEEEEKDAPPKSKLRRAVGSVLDFLDQTWLQTLQYIVFLIAFQSLTGTIRKPSEFYFDKYLTDTFISNTFDAAHNRFEDVRRISDIWEWSSNVLVPGLFSNADVNETWPDGDGLFSLEGATPLTTSEVVDSFNVMSFSHGIVFKQVRAEPLKDRKCYANHTCYSSVGHADRAPDAGDSEPYGYGAAAGKFTWWSADELGANPTGITSASPISQRLFPSSGYVAMYKPFFSDTLLPDQSGTHMQVMDYRLHEATPTNGKAPTYYCARSSYNGHHIEQRCNPNPASNDAIARTMMSEMLTYLKRGHWLDAKTRLFSITMQMRNQNAGVRFIVRYMFELTQMGAIIPSYDMETIIDDDENTEAMKLWMTISLGLTIWFMFLEGVELAQSGPIEYFTNMWNVMDWTNFAIFLITYSTLVTSLDLNARDRKVIDEWSADGPASSHCSMACRTFGFYDEWEVFNVARDSKFFMSICVCIQLLKIIKFTNVIIPKMSLMTRVLSKGCYDLLFFGLIFSVSMFAFCMLFYIQLGSFMDDFYSQTSSMIALAKALFGDFPFEEIVDNSRGYTNAILFLTYLFVAVFILLSMFLAILGEAQAAVRDDENFLKEQGLFPNQYGFLGEAKDWFNARVERMRNRHKSEEELKAAAEAAAEVEKQQQQENPGLDVALNTALVKMQKKLDGSVKMKIMDMEGRLIKGLEKLDALLGDRGGVHSLSKQSSNDFRSSSKGDGDRIYRARSESPDRGRAGPGLSAGSKEAAGRMTGADYERAHGSSRGQAHDERARSVAMDAAKSRTVDGLKRVHSSVKSAMDKPTTEAGAAKGNDKRRRRSIGETIDISPTASPKGGGGAKRGTQHRDALAC